ncbi:MAG: metallophosphoesterase family protein [Cyanobacteriota bacterium]|nr:metallophosphoesterase family protein [Cyanobacteriota bacterium]
MVRRLFVGDIHGHYDALRRLWDLIMPTTTDAVYFLGDLIDRGPQSAEVVNFVRRHGSGCVRGNHEQMLLESFVDDGIYIPAMQRWINNGGDSTIASYENSFEALRADLEWIENLPLYIDLGNVWLVHAGLNPNLTVDCQTQEECCWSRGIFHQTRSPYFADKQIIVGHTMTFTFPQVSPGQLVEGPGWSNIDTGAYDDRSGWLTALDWDNQMVYQVNVFAPDKRVLPYADLAVPVQVNRRRSSKVKLNWWHRVRRSS